MSFTTKSANDIALTVFQAASFPSYGSDLYIGLYTGVPDTTGNDATVNEAAFSSYTRQAVVRTSSGWSVVGNTGSNVAVITFPTATSAGPETETYIGITDASSGASEVIAYGLLTNPITVTLGTIVQFGVNEIQVQLM